ncbi:CLL_collapsed_G0035110.mRNA.1.CDS.1 [Saccharomyces cerevisiae]|uniref:K7_Spa2p n=1 Tax=Saccharomyces cerevisiae (strain Kyokai no. 7 / NBRC 101557) TaxID=721032 RepID=G2WIH4_YEASK|nr:K7_Spa2p [Saccharomyces cerevisiae Kyokai no. 7]CAI5287175.1 CLL_HP2_G0030180.mRNA.1.CDS.1 [Saccharomyces cerevisiae]CAI6577127.1 CLL_HP2_G0030180.mRNA.1.CDS.1 [Saccharomyces cerevisiae]CAI6682921.1 CLL_HP1_G0034690.mRNA.1.CDS.1 [Saccharomyces cerevisiae]CAI7401624.1 CLL_collapsed_G0035110.mRNA.1.CDS.1 [Saccharomyces cerevisiae]
MGTSSEVSLAHHRDIFHYYVSLKTFFEVTGENRDRSNSTRAQKARAKLLKLSSSQFYELSTDVSDELQRRIGEDANQPDYLLPKANFHMKRNQARQKLANLSQTRFNDLLDDILFEIKRRGFDKDLDAPWPPLPQPMKQEVSKDSNDTARTSTNSSSVTQVAPNVSVQPSLVIPKMASIDWSSEEEEEEQVKEKPNEPEGKQTSTDEKKETKPALDPIVTDSDLPDSQVLARDITSMARTPTTTHKNYWDVNDSPIIKVDNDIDNEKGPEQLKSPEVQRAENNNPSSEMEDKVKELTDLNSDLHLQIEDLNAKLASLTSEKEKEKKEEKEEKEKEKNLKSNYTIDESFQKELLSLNSQIGELSIENENLKQKISEFELHQKKNDNHNDLKITDGFISKYSSADGLIPAQYILNANNLIIQFTTRLSAVPIGDSTAISHQIGEELFQILSQLSNLISQLLLSADLLQYKDQVILLKASLSHAITSIRYFSVYGPVLIPKITVQAAVSEVGFAMCNLIDSAKIKSDSNGESTTSNEGNPQVLEYSSPTATTPMTPTFPSTSGINMKKGFINPRKPASFLNDVEEEESPVKPLKITQKAINSPIIRPSSSNGVPTTSRKPSGTGLFSLMIDSSIAKNSSHKEDNDKYVSPIKAVTSASNSASSNISEIPKLTLPPQAKIGTVIPPSENQVPNIKIENTEEDNKRSDITNEISVKPTSSIADKLKHFEQSSEKKSSPKENPIAKEEMDSKPKLSNKFITSMNDVSTDDSSSDGNENDDADDDDDFTYMALKQTMKREGSKIEKNNDSKLPANIVELDLHESPESVKIESPESIKEITSSEMSSEMPSSSLPKRLVEDVEPSEMSEKGASVEPVRKKNFQEPLGDVESPDMTQKVKSLGMTGKAVGTESASRVESPGMTGQIKSLDMTGKAVDPESDSRVESPGMKEQIKSLGMTGKAVGPESDSRVESPGMTGQIKSLNMAGKVVGPEADSRVESPGMTGQIKSLNMAGKVVGPEADSRVESPGMTGQIKSLNMAGKVVGPEADSRVESPGMKEQIKSLGMTGKIAAQESIKSPEAARKLASSGEVDKIESPRMVRESESLEAVGNTIPSNMTVKMESPNLKGNTVSEPQEIRRDIASSEPIENVDPPKVLKKIVFPKAVNRTGSPKSVEKTPSSATLKKSGLPEPNSQIVSPELAKNSPLAPIKKNVELRETNKPHTETITSVEPTNKDANTSWRDADLNRTIKREEEDEDFDRVNHNIQITGADTKTGKIDYHKIPVDRKAKSDAEVHTSEEDIDESNNVNGKRADAQIHITERKHAFVNPTENSQVKKTSHSPFLNSKPVQYENSESNGGINNHIKIKNTGETTAHDEKHYSDDDDSSYQFVPMKHEEQEQEQNRSEEEESEDDDEEEEDSDFDVDTFDIENPDNTLSELLLYLEHQTMDVISTIQSLLTSIKKPQVTKGNLRGESNAINQVIGQMVDATSISMEQSRNANLKKHGDWVVQSLRDCSRRMTILCQLTGDGILAKEKSDQDYADKNFKQRLAGIAFDVAKCTKELVKTVEEASLKDEINYLNSKLK